MNWPMVKLGEVCEVVGGGTPKTGIPEYWDGDIPWLTPRDLSSHQELFISKGSRSISKAGLAKSSAQLLPAGTVLWSSRAPIGYVAIASNEIATNQGFKSFVPGPKVDSQYLAQALRFMKEPLQELGTGATFKEVSAKRAREISIPLPPREEQKRIAKVLGVVSLQIAKLELEEEALHDALQSHFMKKFLQPTLMGKRNWTTIDRFVTSTQYGTSKKANSEKGIPVLRMGNITNSGHVDMSDLKYVELNDEELSKYRLENRDLLFNRTNSAELVGKTAVFFGDTAVPVTFAGYLVRARTSHESEPEYISGFLNSIYGKAVLRNKAKAIVGMANINAKEFLKIPIPYASKREQQEYAGFSQTCNQLAGCLSKKKELLKELEGSLSARAFSGKL